ncbi:hypothetical protein FIV42_18800 [Persicimonas caeni]|uniref:Uncharacterized protein n=1 Tax=Persicimonas caeni TaxID=2292766 RepID=A0A4Y6PWT5_PERCE|nr:hypothetical protein [Persicimonas caeni]QDG52713.1 hypothetical protein FIV42_18800 [Persicimonas caeni]QED33935.1 hypothetical protein FRD00_18795 [Persicimonas caeni]
MLRSFTTHFIRLWLITATLAAPALGSVACDEHGQGANPEVSDVAPSTDSEPDASVDSTGQDVGDEGCRDPLEGQTGSGEAFAKPEAGLAAVGDIRGIVDPDSAQPAEGYSNRMRRVLRPREHMRPSSRADEVWLHEGEYAVMDAAYVVTGEELNPPKLYELFVFVDFEPVEFGVIPVNPELGSEPFPSLEEARGVDEWVRSKTVDLQIDQPVAFTLVLPPSVFPEKSAYDVRVSLVGRPPRDSGKAMGIGEVRSHSLILNYGTTAFTHAAAVELESGEGGPVAPPEYLRAEMRSFAGFVEPPEEVWDPSSLDPPAVYDDVDLAQIFEVEADTARLRAWLRSSSREPQAPMYVVALDGQRALDAPRGYVELPARPSDYFGTQEKFAVEVPFELAVEPERVHAVQLLSFSNPYCRSGRREVSSSNIVHVTRQ